MIQQKSGNEILTCNGFLTVGPTVRRAQAGQGRRTKKQLQWRQNNSEPELRQKKKEMATGGTTTKSLSEHGGLQYN